MWYIIQHLPCFLLSYQMDLVDHPDKESLSLQGFQRKKKIAGVQISLQKTAESKSKSYSEAMVF